jgi:hypothetical protein
MVAAPVSAACAALGELDPQLAGMEVAAAGYILPQDPRSEFTLVALLRGPGGPRVLGIDSSMLMLSVDGRATGRSLQAWLPPNVDISHVHQCIEQALSWVVQARTSSLVTLMGYRARGEVGGSPVVKVELTNPLSGSPADLGARVTGIVGVPTRTIASRAKLTALQAALKMALDSARDEHGLSRVHQYIVNFENCTFQHNVIHQRGDPHASDFEELRETLMAHAQARRLRKAHGHVYEPVPGCPRAFVQGPTYGDFVNRVLGREPAYLRSPRRYDDMLKFLTNYRPAQMPELEHDPCLLSFSNGVLHLSNMRFEPYSQASPPSLSSPALPAARHHIPGAWTGSPHTPLLDRVLAHQFEPEVADILCALLGRTLVPLNLLDRWQVMPFLVGIGGTGKSLILTVLQHLFAPHGVQHGRRATAPGAVHQSQSRAWLCAHGGSRGRRSAHCVIHTRGVRVWQ